MILDRLKRLAWTQTPERLLGYGLLVRTALLIYAIAHDHYVDHIKFTDIDYKVFTNGSKALLEGDSPYRDTEFRYPPIVALIFTPNRIINENFGKLMLIIVDIISGRLLYMLNVCQGTSRAHSKLYLILWLFNPLTLAISTRGSFEPIINLSILWSLWSLVGRNYFQAGLLYGLSIHLKMYPIIYGLSFYIFLVQKKPYLRNQSKVWYWLKTLWPGSSHFKFFSSSLAAIALSTYISFKYYGPEYLEQSLFFHLKRKDLQHNFSVYFYLFRLFPNYQEQLSKFAFVLQSLGVLILTSLYSGFDANRRIRLRKLTYSLFATTFLFVSLNKVCTSQYFTWYLLFVPLVADSESITPNQAVAIALSWLLSQANWLLFAYLYEYQGVSNIDQVGNSSILFLASNLWILYILCCNFDAKGG